MRLHCFLFLMFLTAMAVDILDGLNPGKAMKQALNAKAAKKETRRKKRQGQDTKSLVDRFKSKLCDIRRRLATPEQAERLLRAENEYKAATAELEQITKDFKEDDPLYRYRRLLVGFDENEQPQFKNADGDLLSKEDLLSSDEFEYDLSHDFDLDGYPAEFEESELSDENGFPMEFDEDELADYYLNHADPETRVAFFKRIGKAFRRVGRSIKRGVRRVGRGFKRFGRRVSRGVRRVTRRVRFKRFKKFGRRFKKFGRRFTRRFKKFGRRFKRFRFRKIGGHLRRFRFRKIGRHFKKGFRKIGKHFKKGWNKVKNFGKRTWNQTKELGKKFGKTIKDVAVKTWKAMKKIAKAIWKVFKCIGKILKKGIFKWLKETFFEVFGGAMKSWNNFYAKKNNFSVDKFFKGFNTKHFGRGIRKAVNKLGGAVNTIKKGIRNIINTVKAPRAKTALEQQLSEDVYFDNLAEEAYLKSETESENEEALAEEYGEQEVAGDKDYKYGGIVSVDYSFSVSVVITFEIGGGSYICGDSSKCDPQKDGGKYFYLGIGGKIDVSVGLGANVMFWDSKDSIPGWAGEFSVGADYPGTECGVDFAVVHSMAPAVTKATALGFSIGCGAGLNPVDVQWIAAYTWITKTYGTENAIGYSEDDDSNAIQNSAELYNAKQENVEYALADMLEYKSEL